MNYYLIKKKPWANTVSRLHETKLLLLGEHAVSVSYFLCNFNMSNNVDLHIKYNKILPRILLILCMSPVADPGFSRGGGANSPGGGGRQHMILPKFPKNCMKLKDFGPPVGAASPKFYYVDLPLVTYFDHQTNYSICTYIFDNLHLLNFLLEHSKPFLVNRYSVIEIQSLHRRKIHSTHYCRSGVVTPPVLRPKPLQSMRQWRPFSNDNSANARKH